MTRPTAICAKSVTASNEKSARSCEVKGLIEDIAIAVAIHYSIKLVRWALVELEVQHAVRTLEEEGSWRP